MQAADNVRKIVARSPIFQPCRVSPNGGSLPDLGAGFRFDLPAGARLFAACSSALDLVEYPLRFRSNLAGCCRSVRVLGSGPAARLGCAALRASGSKAHARRGCQWWADATATASEETRLRSSEFAAALKVLFVVVGHWLSERNRLPAVLRFMNEFGRSKNS